MIRNINITKEISKKETKKIHKKTHTNTEIHTFIHTHKKKPQKQNWTVLYINKKSVR